jgi:hypothetical protein
VSGVRYQGEWKEDIPVGRGVATYTNEANNLVNEQFVEGKIYVDQRASNGITLLPMVKMLTK